MSDRQKRRVRLSYMAHIASMAGAHICDCALVEVSEDDARLAVLSTDIVPDQFHLMLSTRSIARRICTVTQRSNDHIDVTYRRPGGQALPKQATCP